MRERVLDVLKRKDVPVKTLDRAITDAIRRIQRTLRTPMTEALAEGVVSSTFSGKVNVPNDLLNLISLQVGGVELTQRAISEVIRVQSAGIGCSAFYTRVAGQYLIAPEPAKGTKITIHYHRDFATIDDVNDSNILMEVCPELVMYGALVTLADWSLDPTRQAAWAQGFATHFGEIQEQADRDLLLNASIGACTPTDGYYQ